MLLHTFGREVKSKQKEGKDKYKVIVPTYTEKNHTTKFTKTLSPVHNYIYIKFMSDFFRSFITLIESYIFSHRSESTMWN